MKKTDDETSGNKWSIKISLTNLCNLACLYCKDSKTNPKQGRMLERDEIVDILRAARANGIVSVQWTGGECTTTDMRFYSEAAYLLGYEEQALTSNGIHLEGDLDSMISLGLNRANISLDSLDEETFRRITGSGSLDKVLKCIERCARSLDLTKINVATMRLNSPEIEKFIEYASRLGSRTVLKFHELWRYTPLESYFEQHLSAEEIFQLLSQTGTLLPLKREDVKGNNPSTQYYLIKEKGVKVGIAAVPTNWICGGPSCKKIRIYTTGRTCEGKNLYGISYDEKVKRIYEIMQVRGNTLVER